MRKATNANDPQMNRAYVLAKNEVRNIGRSLDALRIADVSELIVLDSGSTDGTIELACSNGARVIQFDYVNHCTAYNKITSEAGNEEIFMILDADVVVSAELVSEINILFRQKPNLEVVAAPVQMYWEGEPLDHCSLYPPKPIAFRGGKEYFEPVGHGERLKDTVVTEQTTIKMIHDDRKDFAQVMQNQVRYARELSRRAQRDELSGRDRIRVRWPFFIFITPFYSYFFKLGFLDGRAGLIYAIDRLIAEALAFRTAISPLAQEEIARERPQGSAHRPDGS